MKFYNVMYNNIVIGLIQAESLEHADEICHKEYDEGIHGFPTVELNEGEKDEQEH